ncbi:MAG: GNAT family N-acetyltransferase [Promethearchaeota archaeon]
MLKLRIFKAEDMVRVLQLANMFASFDGTTSEADLVVSKFFPEGFWVAEEDNDVIGFVFGYFKDAPLDVLIKWDASKVGEISLLVVDPDYRRRGIGTALLKKVMEEFKRAGADLIILACPAEAIEARKLYEKLGFEVRAYHMKQRL